MQYSLRQGAVLIAWASSQRRVGREKKQLAYKRDGQRGLPSFPSNPTIGEKDSRRKVSTSGEDKPLLEVPISFGRRLHWVLAGFCIKE